MKYKLLKKVTAVMLSILITVTGVNIETFNSFLNVEKVVSFTEVKAKEKKTEKEPYIVKELKNLRTEDSSTYLLSNGLKRVEYYSNNIRYEKNGKYIDYDSTLRKVSNKEKNELEQKILNYNGVNKVDAEKYLYTNTSGDAKHYFPKSLKDTGILMKKNNYVIHFIPNIDTEKNEQFNSQTETFDKENKEALQNQESEVIENKENDSIEYGMKEKSLNEIIYENKGGNIAYKYSSQNNGIKEEIIINSKPENNVFRFEINAENLELLKTEYDKTIRIRNYKTRKQIAYIDAPNIRDQNGKISYSEVNYKLEKIEEGKYELSIVVDNEYLEKAQYPVSVDPTVVWFEYAMPTAALTNMPYTMDMNLRNTSYMEVQNKCNHIGPYEGTEKYCYIDTSGVMNGNAIAGHPQHLEDMYVEKATLRLTEYETNGYSPQQGVLFPYTVGTVEVRAIEGAWDADTLTWNNHPEMGEKIWAEFQCTGVKYTQHYIDLTDWARAVTSKQISNDGLALRAKEENTGDTFYSEKYHIITDENGTQRVAYAYLTIDYRDAGRYYGREGVYAPTGNYSETFADMSVQTVLGNIAVSRTYNSLQVSQDSFVGKGFGLNYGMRVISGSKFVRIVMPDSSRWNFENDGCGGYIALDNKGTLTYENNQYKLVTIDMMEYGFNTDGYLEYVKDYEGNQINITTNSKGQILSLTDKSGTLLRFTYAENQLTKIEDVKNDSVVQTVSYTYNDDYLIKVVFPGGMERHYEYTDGKLSKISDSGKNGQGKMKVLDITYYTSGQYDGMVKTITNTIGVTSTYTYDFENHTTVMNDNTSDNASIRKMRYTYNDAWAITKEEDLNLEIDDKQVNSIEFSNNSTSNLDPERPASNTDKYGNITNYEYDKNGNLTKTIYPDASMEVAVYDEETNDLLKLTDRNGLVTENTYSNGLLISTKTGGKVTNSFTYYPETTYGIEGLVKTETDAHGNVTEYTYDVKGNIITSNRIIDGKDHITTNTYDEKGQITKTVDPEGICTEYIYNDSGVRLLTRVKDKNGNNIQVTRNVHDVLGREIQVIGPIDYDATKDNLTADLYSDSSVGNYTTYNSKGQVVSERDALGNVTRYVYDTDGNVKKEIKPNGSYYTSEYDKDGRKIKEKFHENDEAVPLLLKQMIYTEGKNEVRTKNYIDNSFVSTTIQEYDWEGHLIKEITPSGAVKTNTYESGLLVKEQMDDGSFTEYTYDAWGRTLTETESFDETGNSKTKYTYDDYGNVLTELEKCNADREQEKYAMTRYAYDSQDNVITVIDGNGNYVQHYYRWDGKILRDYKGMKAPLTINGEDNVENPYNQDYSVIKYEYDTMGRLQKRIDALGNEEIYAYDKAGRQTKVTDREGTEHITQYDKEDNPVKEISGNITKEYTYDCMGNVETEKEGNTTTTYTYDGRNNCVKEECRDIVKTYQYNNSNMLTEHTISIAGAQKQKISNTYDVAGNKTHVYENDILKASYKYNKWGQLTKTTNANGTMELKSYNLAGLVTSVINKKANKVLSGYGYTYYYDGKERTETDISGTTIYLYDGSEALKKEIKLNTPTDNTTKEKAADIDVNLSQYINIETSGQVRYYKYTPINTTQYTLKSFHNSGDPQVMLYNSEGSLISQGDDEGGNYNFKLAATLNAGITYVIAVKENSGVGSFEFMLEQSQSENTAMMYAKTIMEDIPEYVNLNQRYQIRYYGITAKETGTYKITTSNKSGDPWLYLYTSEGKWLAGGNTPGSFDKIEYTFTAGERYIIGAKVYAGTGNFILNVTPPSHGKQSVTEYTYDGHGNRTKLKVHEKESVQETDYTYDENDRLLTETTDNNVVTYTYDKNGNMLENSEGIKHTFDALNRMKTYTSKAGITTTYSYYADDMRKSKKVGNGTEIMQIWVDEDIVLEMEDETVRSNYVYGEKLIGSSYGWYLYNEHEDVTALTDNHGTVTKDYQYDSFGVQISETDDTDKNPYRYNGEYYDAESGYTYLQTRYYHPNIGRFISEDPAMDGNNWYVYCGNNPVNMVDPTGMWAQKIHKRMTRKAFNDVKAELGWEDDGYPATLLSGSTLPDRSKKYASHNWHGHKGYVKVKNNQLKKAVAAWRNNNKEKAYRELGKGLHTIQDHYAHTFRKDGNTINTWSYVKNKFTIEEKTGNIIAGMYPQYIDEKFMKKLTESGEEYIGKNVHQFTADNVNAYFSTKKNKWVWNDGTSKRYKKAIKQSKSYVKKFAKQVKTKAKKKKKKKKK